MDDRHGKGQDIFSPRSLEPHVSNHSIRDSTRRPFFSILSLVTGNSLLTHVIYQVYRGRLAQASSANLIILMVFVVEILVFRVFALHLAVTRHRFVDSIAVPVMLT